MYTRSIAANAVGQIITQSPAAAAVRRPKHVGRDR
jgi:hypothetical protein